MYNYQKGLLPLIFSFLGILIPGVFFAFGAKTLIPLYINSIDSQPTNKIIEITISLLIGLSLYLALPLFFGVLLSGLFPAIKITKKGVGYLYFGGLLKGEILWEEVVALDELTNGYSIIRISRVGLSILNGLYVNSLYGKLVRVFDPIIFISPGLENRENIIVNIQKYIKSSV